MGGQGARRLVPSTSTIPTEQSENHQRGNAVVRVRNLLRGAKAVRQARLFFFRGYESR